MKIVLAADHAGFKLKEALKPHLLSSGYEVLDVGAKTYDPTDDYPEYCAAAARMVASDPDAVRGVVIGGSGQGEAITANRFKGVRAVVYYGVSDGAREAGIDILTLSREHNDANVLSLGARCITTEEACDAVLRWLTIPFSQEERHVRRIGKVDTA